MLHSFDTGLAIKDIRNRIKLYLNKNPQIKAFVLGMSGGIDSALVAALVKPVCKEYGIKLHGFFMPIETNTSEEHDRAAIVGTSLCDDFQETSITKRAYADFLAICNTTYAYEFNPVPIRLGNIKARLRMIFLFNEAHKNNGIVLSTDNYTEYLLGFWTKHGDVGDFSPIQLYWKTEVYEMARWIRDNEDMGFLQPTIDAVPTDGLGITKSDLDQFGEGIKSYEDVDRILELYLKSNCDASQLSYTDKQIIQRYETTHHKRHDPIILNRYDGLIFDKSKFEWQEELETANTL